MERRARDGAGEVILAIPESKIFARALKIGTDLRATVACSTCYFREDSKITGGLVSRTAANLKNYSLGAFSREVPGGAAALFIDEGAWPKETSW